MSTLPLPESRGRTTRAAGASSLVDGGSCAPRPPRQRARSAAPRQRSVEPPRDDPRIPCFTQSPASSDSGIQAFQGADSSIGMDDDLVSGQLATSAADVAIGESARIEVEAFGSFSDPDAVVRDCNRAAVQFDLTKRGIDASRVLQAADLIPSTTPRRVTSSPADLDLFGVGSAAGSAVPLGENQFVEFGSSHTISGGSTFVSSTAAGLNPRPLSNHEAVVVENIRLQEEVARLQDQLRAAAGNSAHQAFAEMPHPVNTVNGSDVGVHLGATQLGGAAGTSRSNDAQEVFDQLPRRNDVMTETIPDRSRTTEMVPSKLLDKGKQVAQPSIELAKSGKEAPVLRGGNARMAGGEVRPRGDQRDGGRRDRGMKHVWRPRSTSRRRPTAPVEGRTGREGDSSAEGAIEPANNGVRRSWADIAGASIPQRRWSIPFEAPDTDGDEILIKAAEEIFEMDHKPWSDCIVGYFIGRRMPFQLVSAVARKMWNKHGLVDVTMGENDFFFFNIPDEGARRRIIDEGNWIVAGQPIFLRQWEPTMTLRKEDHSTLPLWVKFFNVPLAMWNPCGIGSIASGVGRPLYADNATEERKLTRFARICVEASAQRKLPDRLKLDFKGETVLIHCEYQWKPTRCEKCLVFGHSCKGNNAGNSRIGGDSSTPVEGQDKPVDDGGGWKTATNRRGRKHGKPGSHNANVAEASRRFGDEEDEAPALAEGTRGEASNSHDIGVPETSNTEAEAAVLRSETDTQRLVTMSDSAAQGPVLKPQISAVATAGLGPETGGQRGALGLFSAAQGPDLSAKKPAVATAVSAAQGPDPSTKNSAVAVGKRADLGVNPAVKGNASKHSVSAGIDAILGLSAPAQGPVDTTTGADISNLGGMVNSGAFNTSEPNSVGEEQSQSRKSRKNNKKNKKMKESSGGAVDKNRSTEPNDD